MGSATFVWDPVPNAFGYEVQIIEWGESWLVPLVTADASGTEAEVGGLEPGVTYGWRVRAKSPAGDGPWSREIAFTTLPNVPEKITVDAPADGASLPYERSTPFEWTTHGLPRDYELRLDPADGSGESFVRIAHGHLEDFQEYVRPHEEEKLVPGKDYLWKVREIDPCDQKGPYSDARQISIEALPPTMGDRLHDATDVAAVSDEFVATYENTSEGTLFAEVRSADGEQWEELPLPGGQHSYSSRKLGVFSGEGSDGPVFVAFFAVDGALQVWTRAAGGGTGSQFTLVHSDTFSKDEYDRWAMNFETLFDGSRFIILTEGYTLLSGDGYSWTKDVSKRRPSTVSGRVQPSLTTDGEQYIYAPREKVWTSPDLEDWTDHGRAAAASGGVLYDEVHGYYWYFSARRTEPNHLGDEHLYGYAFRAPTLEGLLDTEVREALKLYTSPEEAVMTSAGPLVVGRYEEGLGSTRGDEGASHDLYRHDSNSNWPWDNDRDRDWNVLTNVAVLRRPSGDIYVTTDQ